MQQAARFGGNLNSEAKATTVNLLNYKISNTTQQKGPTTAYQKVCDDQGKHVTAHAATLQDAY